MQPHQKWWGCFSHIFFRYLPQAALRLYNSANFSSLNLYMNISTRLRKGFTLIELLIVIVIIGILAVGLVPKVIDAPKRARDTVRKKDLDSLRTALTAYASDYNAFPDSNSPCLNPASAAYIALGSYFSGNKIPQDPVSTKTNGDCGSQGAYIYKSFKSPPASPNINCYIIGAELETGKGGNSSATPSAAAWCNGVIPPGAAADKLYQYIVGNN